MNEPEQAILQTLAELQTAVESMRPANPRLGLQPLFARLDDLARQLPPDAAPELLHYLRNKSYEKARLWLEGREAENARGTCRESKVESRGPGAREI